MFLIAAILKVVITIYLALNIMVFYLIGIAIFCVWFYLKAKHATDIHIHHYCIGMAVVSLCCYQDVFITLVSGVFNGIMIEGASRWGYDPIFEYDNSKVKKVEEQLKKAKIRKEN